MYQHNLKHGPARVLMAALVLALVAMAFPIASHAEEAGIALKPGQVAAGGPTGLALADEPAAEPSTTVVEKVEVKEEETETAEALPAWPPGLMMDGLNAIGVGQAMGDLRLRAYGWVETGFTGIVLGPGSSRKGLPLRVFDARKPDNFRLHQLKFTLDRVVDTSASFDIGGRADFIYGTDSRVIHSRGLLDKQNHDVQPDLQQLYAELWLKTGEGGQGFDVVFGKWVTTMGAEVIDAPSNYLYSRSLLFGYAIPFAHTGLKVSYYLDPTNLFYMAAVRGWDNWEDNNDGASWMGGFLLSSKDQCGALPQSQLALNVIAGPEQTGDGHPGNRVVLDAVWTYRWTEKLTQVVNADFGYENDVPGALNSAGIARNRDSDWYGVAYYLNYVFNEYVNGTARAEWFRDHRGVRTGFQGDFYEVTTGLTITPFPCDRWLKDLIIRPELRWDWSANNDPFVDDGCQMTAGLDVIYKF